MKVNLPSAVRTALCCLWAPMVGLIGCVDEPTPTLPTTTPPEAQAPTDPAEPDDEAAPEEEEALPALEADVAVWPLALEAFEILDATFENDRLLLVTAAADGVSLVRMARAKEATDTSPVEQERRLIGPPQTPLTLAPIGIGAKAAYAAFWVADGHLHALSLALPLADATARVIAAEEGGAFTGPVVVAPSGPTDELLACVRDGNRPLCVRLDHELSPIGVHPIDRKDQVIRWLGPTPNGWIALLTRCRTEECTRENLEVLAFDRNGVVQGKPRALPELDSVRNTAIIGTDDGLLLVGRRRGAGEHTAWNVTPRMTSELEGRFSRVIGGFTLGGSTKLVERSHLRMRQGFPVAGIDLRPLGPSDFDGKSSRRKDKRVERERFPDHIAQHLPAEVDQRFSARGDTLVFTSPRIKGILKAAVVKVSDKGPRP